MDFDSVMEHNKDFCLPNDSKYKKGWIVIIGNLKYFELPIYKTIYIKSDKEKASENRE